jgi:hypothetical protein
VLHETQEEAHVMVQQAHGQAVQAPAAGEAATDATKCNADATKRPLTSTERSRIFRAKQRVSGMQRDAVACNVAVAPPLSPKRVDPKKEAPVARATSPPGAHPLPDDWQPTAGRRLTAMQKGGEIGAANLIAKFCNHFHARAHEIRTAAGWQGRFSNWTVTEWPDGREPRLPLLRPLPPDDKWEALRRNVHGARPLHRESG